MMNGFRDKCLNKGDMEGLLEKAGYKEGDAVYKSMMNKYRNTDVAMDRGITDKLTGAFGQAYFKETLGRELARQKRSKKMYDTSLLDIDIDNFKTVNDGLGHGTGDKVLAQAGNVIRHALRETDSVYRVGGDEFAVILPETSDNGAGKLKRRISKRAENRMQRFFHLANLFGMDIDSDVKEIFDDVDFSIGKATSKYHDVKGIPKRDVAKYKESFIASADKDMYREKRAKGAGR